MLLDLDADYYIKLGSLRTKLLKARRNARPQFWCGLMKPQTPTLNLNPYTSETLPQQGFYDALSGASCMQKNVVTHFIC